MQPACDTVTQPPHPPPSLLVASPPELPSSICSNSSVSGVALQGVAHASDQLDAVGLTGMMAKYLHVWDSASSLDVVPDLEFVATLEFTNECSKVESTIAGL